MDYIRKNKKAWEESFDRKRDGWGEDDYKDLLDEELPFLEKDLLRELESLNLRGKKVGQFCCNNGRELLSLMSLGPEEGVGFDLAENIIGQAEETARKAKIGNCKFIARNILDIGPEYKNYFDLIIFTVGGITWFEDLDLLFTKVSDCLRTDGILLINDFHPIMNSLALVGEEDFDKNNMKKLVGSYFKTEPWIENKGMAYIADEFDSETFTSYSHTMSNQINAIISSGMNIVKFLEYDYDIGLCQEYNNLGIPLSFILMAKKY